MAYSADGGTILWSTSSSGVLRSQNLGAFERVTTLSASAIVASDRRNGSVSYAGSAANFYISTDEGRSFKKAGILGNAASIRDIAPHPTIAGEVWVSTDVGLFRSVDYGIGFARAGPDLTNTYQAAFGLGSGDKKFQVYAFGSGKAGSKLYASASNGSTWIDIQGEQGFGDISGCRLAGSGNVPGQVYVGTNGRGVFYGVFYGVFPA